MEAFYSYFIKFIYLYIDSSLNQFEEVNVGFKKCK